ncbi:heme-binding protein (plasmid) [Escherichia albertii]|nr:heme-binding protein [Escherichia albertii]WKU78491.1 heme-binding protein [Escherichia albertii]
MWGLIIHRQHKKKAYTALSTKSDTRELAKKAVSNPETQNLNTVPQLLLLGGGVPVKSGNMVIGAIGVAGMGGPQMISTVLKKP